MPNKFIDRKKRENWDREEDKELARRYKAAEKKTAAETKKHEGDEFLKLNKEIGKEKIRRDKVVAAGTRKRERAEETHNVKKFAI